MEEKYQNRVVVLKQLGFSQYGQYTNSLLWTTIKRTVLHHRECTCENQRCHYRNDEVVKQVHHLSYTTPIMLGINPSQLVVLCRHCHEWCEYSGGVKLELQAARLRTLMIVGAPRLIAGQSNPKVGSWFRNRYQLNRVLAQTIFKKLEEELPCWAKYIRLALKMGKIPNKFQTYLGLT